MERPGRLQGKVAIVTGGSRGIGAAMVRSFVSEGAKVVIGDVLEDVGQKVAAEFGPDLVRFERLDVRSEANWQEVVASTEDAFGPPTILVHSAGVMIVASIEETTEEQLRFAYDVNVVGVFFGTRSVIAPMKKAGGGSVLVFSSSSGLEGSPGFAAYAASKAANANFTRSAAMELGQYGIRVNALAPGGVDSPMNSGPEFEGVDKDAWCAKLPIPRIGQPADIVPVALLMVSDESAYMTGTIVSVDGGRLAGGVS